MKKILMAILVAILSLSTVFALTACGEEEVKVTVTYDANGGQVSSQTQEINVDDFTLLVPTREGYTFKGWTLNGNTFTNENRVTNDITLVATWELNKFNVTFEVGSRGILDGEKTRTLNAIGYELPTPTTKPGATFKGWKLNGTAFATGTILNGNITLVADYDITGYTVTLSYPSGAFLYEGETLIDEDQDGEYVNLYDVTGFTLPIVERTGYTFKGWKLNGETFNATTLTDDVTLVADLEISKYKLVYYKNQTDLINGEPRYDEQEVVYGEDFSYIGDPEEFGKTFLGWKAYINGVPVDFEEGEWDYEQNIDVYATWVNDTFKIKWVASTDNSAKFADETTEKITTPEVLNLDDADIIEAIPVDELGRDFLGWKYDNGTTDAGDDIDVVDEADLLEIIENATKDVEFRLYAVFDTNSYVVFKVDGQIIAEKQVAEVGKVYAIPTDRDAVAKINAFDKEGYHVEWKANGVPYDASKPLFDTTPVGVEIVAELVANTVSVEYKVWCDCDSATCTKEGSVANVTKTTLTTGEILTANGVQPNSNYMFIRWTDVAFEGQPGWTAAPAWVAADGTVTISDAMYESGSVTLYAIFYNPIMS